MKNRVHYKDPYEGGDNDFSAFGPETDAEKKKKAIKMISYCVCDSTGKICEHPWRYRGIGIHVLEFQCGCKFFMKKHKRVTVNSFHLCPEHFDDCDGIAIRYLKPKTG